MTTIEEKAKAYDKAIERAKDLISRCKNDRDRRTMIYRLEDIESLFPELTESEDADEKIRKALIKLVTNHASMDLFIDYDIHLDEALAWLEKQGEHAKFLNKIQIGDKVTRNEDGVLVNLSQLNRVAKKDEKQGENNMGISEATKKKLEDNLNKALEKETPESCNEFLDEQDYQPVNTDYISRIRVGLLNIEGNAKNINGLTESQWVAIRAANRLLAEYIEKVQQKPAWKPSDEQMDALHYVTNFDYGGHKATLVSLYEQLKKLKG